MNTHHAVIEKTGSTYHVTLHPTAEKADEYALDLALENTAYTEEEIREHLKEGDRHEEGDWGVYVTDATVVE